jgi:hypothetical protein
MKKNHVKHKLDDFNDNAEILTEYECSRRENVAKNDEYLSSLGLTNMQVVNPLK